MPSTRDSVPSSDNTSINTAAPAITGSSKRSVRAAIASGRISALRPRISSRLTMLVPARLPTASAPLPSRAETTPMASSGMLVPMDTTVRPMTIGLIPNRAATSAPPRTIMSAPNTRAARPTRNPTASVSIATSLSAMSSRATSGRRSIRHEQRSMALGARRARRRDRRPQRSRCRAVERQIAGRRVGRCTIRAPGKVIGGVL